MNHDEISGWKEIAAYLGKGVRTAQRWEADLGLPVRRIPGPGGEIIYALRSEIDQWKADSATTKAGQNALQAADDGEQGNQPEDRPNGAGRSPNTIASDRVDPNSSATLRWNRTRTAAALIGLACVVLVTGAAALAWWPKAGNPPRNQVVPRRPGSQNDGLARGGWPTFAHDMQRSNQSDLAGPANPGVPRLVLSSPLGFSHDGPRAVLDSARIVSTPTGMILFGACGSVSAADLSGRLHWQSPLAAKPFLEGLAGLAIASAGWAFVATQECSGVVSTRVNVYRLAPKDGSITFLANVGEMSYPPGVAPNGDWYTISDTNLVRGFHYNSVEEAWKTDLPAFSHGAIALDSRNNLYVGTDGGNYNQQSLWSLEPEQLHVRWKAEAPVFATTVVTDDDRVCAAGGGRLYCYDSAHGRELWSREVGSVSGSASPLAVGHTGNIYVRSGEGLIAFDPDGHERWRKPPGDGPRLAPGPILDKDENIYTALGNEVRSYTPAGRLRWNRPLPDPGVMIIAADGVLCVTSERRNLYAIESPGTTRAGGQSAR